MPAARKSRKTATKPGAAKGASRRAEPRAQSPAAPAKRAKRGVVSAPEAFKRGRGLTTTPDERAMAARIEQAFHDAGLELARVVAVAKNKAGAMLRIERVPLADIDKVRAALSTLRKQK